MTKKPTWLLAHLRDVHSQFGEDGIVEKILGMLPERDRWCVEFGAWDGMHLSNARNLIENHGYSAVLIEGSRERYLKLVGNYAARTNVLTMNTFVGFGGDGSKGDNLDTLLGSTPIPTSFDYLSIDIDGNDYHVWRAVSKYRPKVVCIEFNISIPTEVVFVQPADPALSQGSSVAAMAALGKEKGYELVSVTLCNAIFVEAKYFPLFEIADNSPHALRTINTYVTYIFSGYDGTVFLSGCKRLLYHDMALYESRMQQLPKALRSFPENYSRVQRMALAAYRVWHSPREMLIKIRARLRGAK